MPSHEPAMAQCVKLGDAAAAQCVTEVGLKRQRVGSVKDLQQIAAACSGALDSAVPAPLVGETMAAYFERLRTQLELDKLQVKNAVDEDGIYIHKRPITEVNGQASLLVLCGSVMHHVLVYVQSRGQLHCFDWGPASGTDITSNIFEAVPGRSIHTAAAAVPPQDTLPFLYVGRPAIWFEDTILRQAITFAESRPYHAITNNCIHVADLLVRVLTAGRVCGAPLLYDMMCGSVPPMDHPMLLMMQLMLKMSWFAICDGQPITAQFLAAPVTQQDADTLPGPAQITAGCSNSTLSTESSSSIASVAVGSAAADEALCEAATIGSVHIPLPDKPIADVGHALAPSHSSSSLPGDSQALQATKSCVEGKQAAPTGPLQHVVAAADHVAQTTTHTNSHMLVAATMAEQVVEVAGAVVIASEMAGVVTMAGATDILGVQRQFDVVSPSYTKSAGEECVHSTSVITRL